MSSASASRLSLLAAAGLLAACSADLDRSSPTRHLSPLSASVTRDLERKGLSPRDPILLRIYKQESELEVWKQAKADGRYKLFKTYPVCRWSGKLGPKIQEGDKQAPEGFYMVTPAQMNPNSSYYLSFNTGFPNAFDRAHGRTGAHLMVHGDCLSAGCYALTDEQIREIYALAREAFAGGQAAFQLQAFPFRMTAENLARHRDNPNMPFWKNLKEGADHFEVTRAEPRIAVCDKRYVFDPEFRAMHASISPTAPCPAFKVPEAIASAVAAKQKKDEAAIEVAAVRLAEEEKARIEAAKPNSVLAAVADAAKAPARANAKEPAAPPARKKASEPPAKAVQPRAQASTEPSGTALGRFLNRLIGRDEEPSPPPEAAKPKPGQKPSLVEGSALRAP